MTTSLEKRCSFTSSCLSVVNIYQFVYLLFSPLCFEVVTWDLIVLEPDHGLYFSFAHA